MQVFLRVLLGLVTACKLGSGVCYAQELEPSLPVGEVLTLPGGLLPPCPASSSECSPNRIEQVLGIPGSSSRPPGSPSAGLPDIFSRPQQQRRLPVIQNPLRPPDLLESGYPPQIITLGNLWEREDDVWHRQRNMPTHGQDGGSGAGGPGGRAGRRRLASLLTPDISHITPGSMAIEVAVTGLSEIASTGRIIQAQILAELDQPLSRMQMGRLQIFAASWGYPIDTPEQVQELRDEFNAIFSTTRGMEILNPIETLFAMGHSAWGTPHTPQSWLSYKGYPTLSQNGFWNKDRFCSP